MYIKIENYAIESLQVFKTNLIVLDTITYGNATEMILVNIPR